MIATEKKSLLRRTPARLEARLEYGRKWRRCLWRRVTNQFLNAELPDFENVNVCMLAQA